MCTTFFRVKATIVLRDEDRWPFLAVENVLQISQGLLNARWEREGHSRKSFMLGRLINSVAFVLLVHAGYSTYERMTVDDEDEGW
jgi:hypothetical protein